MRVRISITFVRFGRQNKQFRLPVMRNAAGQFGCVDSVLCSGTATHNPNFERPA